jgi:hypothetical protein
LDVKAVALFGGLDMSGTLALILVLREEIATIVIVPTSNDAGSIS